MQPGCDENCRHVVTHGHEACFSLTLRRDAGARGNALVPQLPRERSQRRYPLLPSQSASSSRPTLSPPFLAPGPLLGLPPAQPLGSQCRPHQGRGLGGRGSWGSRRGEQPPPPPRGRSASCTPEAFAPTLKLAARSSKHCHHTDDILLLQRKVI